MTITRDELAVLENRINDQLASYKTTFSMSVHFGIDRVNHLRNVPPITIVELQSIFNRFITCYIPALLALNDGDTFNIRCQASHINMPCGVTKVYTNTVATQKNIVITVMRKQDFKASVTKEFTV